MEQSSWGEVEFWIPKKKFLQRPRGVFAEHSITYLQSQLWLCGCKKHEVLERDSRLIFLASFHSVCTVDTYFADPT